MLADCFCAVCVMPVNLAYFEPEVSDYVLTCGHFYYSDWMVR